MLVPALAVSAPAMAATRVPAHYPPARVMMVHGAPLERNLPDMQKNHWKQQDRRTGHQGRTISPTSPTPPSRVEAAAVAHRFTAAAERTGADRG